jgi:hypothetical protein
MPAELAEMVIKEAMEMAMEMGNFVENATIVVCEVTRHQIVLKSLRMQEGAQATGNPR